MRRGQNRKSRPDYCNKGLALASLLRALETIDRAPDVVFLNDGSDSEDRLELMRHVGQIVRVTCGSHLGAHRAALRLTTGRSWPGRDLGWRGERALKGRQTSS